MSATISKSNFQFLKDIANNNNRDWFAANKDRYQAAHADSKAFIAELGNQMEKIDNIERVKLFRIYRDVRFSKNKTPYKNNWGIGLNRATALLRGGYYINIEPGNSFIAGGFWNPNSADLKRIRMELASDAKPLRKIINSAKFKKTFGQLSGDGVKSAPRGFDKEHPDIDLIRMKQFLVYKTVPNKMVLSKDFMKEITTTFKAMHPFFDYMSDVLTTDINGVPLYE